ncbi:MAG: hypothetical protein WD648_13280 [Planctomycetaceae bacterium]
MIFKVLLTFFVGTVGGLGGAIVLAEVSRGWAVSVFPPKPHSHMVFTPAGLITMAGLFAGLGIGAAGGAFAGSFVGQRLDARRKQAAAAGLPIAGGFEIVCVVLALAFPLLFGIARLAGISPQSRIDSSFALYFMLVSLGSPLGTLLCAWSLFRKRTRAMLVGLVVGIPATLAWFGWLLS